ncbi:type II secretion system ATPase GspE [Haliovirga abyssi]|uniref:protein-secreting ATPase n=1 Tax=Haliovirga abyssi TaxID=2996794 RepID=A0AAU9DCB2_9FUSO|nr:type II secretion system ATPase GspE [Haliovirga abyssi]BDU49778.1 hypothetical protein HLVA_03470 [Haliovirga abyssi]
MNDIETKMDNVKKKYKIIYKNSENGLNFFATEKLSLEILDDLETYLEEKVNIEIISKNDMKKYMEEYSNEHKAETEEIISDLGKEYLQKYKNINIDTEIEDLEELAKEAPIINLVNTIITEAVKKGASDIHIEPFDNNVNVRYRVDGVLHQETTLPNSLTPAITTRIKIMSNLDIAEKRLPQDGRIRIKVMGKEIDIRVAIIPTLHGENSILRLLDKTALSLSIESIGFTDENKEKFMDLIKNSSGIILVTGPTGSGKTTTLYSTLSHLNTTEKKIITIEDPIEYQLKGINQIQVKPEIGFTFAKGLRSVLRQDPDIIMVGEIRDLETAKIATQAALTGHLVFATLHTNDAVGAVARLIDIGVEDYLVASSLKGVISQRLVRKLCETCKEEYIPDEIELKGYKKIINKDDKVYKAKGCELCNELGYSGRTGIHEVLVLNDNIRETITNFNGVMDIKKAAIASGMKDLTEDGLEKVKEGITTIDEVMRVTKS